MPEPPYPLHESIRDLVHPEYAAFYNEHIINKQQVHYQPLAASRTSGILIPGAGPMIPVGKTQDFSIKRQESEGPDVKVRCFTPAAEKEPAGGWPVLLYYHGGGWVLGNIDTENVVCSNICARANCVVVTTDYSVARSFPPLRIQLLHVPVMDNTANVSNNRSYRDYEHTPALPAAKMLWFRHHYLPNESDRSNPEASPLFYPDSAATWNGLPHAIVVVGELDVLREEGEQYAAKLKKNGVSTDLHVMQGQPHPFLAMDGVLEAGRQAITYMVEGCKTRFY
ncbi:conserved hypothetical protein [Uncinocarpus reesii 1704]|uniref:Alpha/beta hydrolase fold-3 domain-containing protein n=1 Tax=Uncinocarpus reesii (strain UAMH 1704) TaxID=336963 RepID=C4JL97_UNCRE|nr:uncharacterized protein UREG_03605 [Uncinocarpus reesii 1704]EEP78759.1 conserved hypothetical protein [Uncinocarpus reesii 1704]